MPYQALLFESLLLLLLYQKCLRSMNDEVVFDMKLFFGDYAIYVVSLASSLVKTICFLCSVKCEMANVATEL